MNDNRKINLEPLQTILSEKSVGGVWVAVKSNTGLLGDKYDIELRKRRKGKDVCRQELKAAQDELDEALKSAGFGEDEYSALRFLTFGFRISLDAIVAKDLFPIFSDSVSRTDKGLDDY
ncbi:MAG: hypothetical protein COV36_02755 [Alphaproteobacteria bacterium CG11_big_fil_rev_8_21_14_0_20_44_7]|nr:MAG: hypothetical protein COV36_02755 [Alphaproteobacteria bacterium CG11_big_fil_rev_8_21_14_0_20_44_7]